MKWSIGLKFLISQALGSWLFLWKNFLVLGEVALIAGLWYQATPLLVLKGTCLVSRMPHTQFVIWKPPAFSLHTHAPVAHNTFFPLIFIYFLLTSFLYKHHHTLHLIHTEPYRGRHIPEIDKASSHSLAAEGTRACWVPSPGATILGVRGISGDSGLQMSPHRLWTWRGSIEISSFTCFSGQVDLGKWAQAWPHKTQGVRITQAWPHEAQGGWNHR